MERILDFLSFADPSVRSVSIGAVMLSASAAVVGCFTLLRKQALIGDAVAHSVLPGVCLAFMLSGSKSPIFLIPGAFITGWLSLQIIRKIPKFSKIKEDAAIALVLSVFFGIGIVLLTNIQHTGHGDQSGLDHFLFGQAAAIVEADLYIFSVVALILIVSVFLFYKELLTSAFDTDFSLSSGMHVKFTELLLTTITVLAVVTGIQAVGVVLIAAMLITPPAAARYWTNNLKVMIVLSAIIGGISGLSGAIVSYAYPGMPTGPRIVLVVTFIAFTSFLLAPKKGILLRMYKQYKITNRILEENVLKDIYAVGLKSGDANEVITETQVASKRLMKQDQLRKGLAKLRKDGFIEQVDDGFRMTTAGLFKGMRLVKLHRLWETYLTTQVGIAADHVHDDAETIEHYITPELEEKLIEELNRPKQDPHDSEIPYE